MSSYTDEIARRGITRLCHFTKSVNLPFILGDGKLERNGILPTSVIKKSRYLERQDPDRYDGHEECVSCSVQVYNKPYLRRSQKRASSAVFNQWAVLYIDPTIIDDTTLFSPVNAASASGRNLHSKMESFVGMFADRIEFEKGGHYYYEDREYGKPANETTDIQAEVMIKGKIPLERIIGVAFPAETYEVERLRLRFCGINTSHLKIERLEE